MKDLKKKIVFSFTALSVLCSGMAMANIYEIKNNDKGYFEFHGATLNKDDMGIIKNMAKRVQYIDMNQPRKLSDVIHFINNNSPKSYRFNTIYKNDILPRSNVKIHDIDDLNEFMIQEKQYRIVYVSNPFGLEGPAIIELEKVFGKKLLISTLKNGKSDIADLDSIDRIIELMQRYMELIEQKSGKKIVKNIISEIMKLSASNQLIDTRSIELFFYNDYDELEAKEIIRQLMDIRNTKGIKYVEVK